MLVVTDTTPINYLVLIGHVDILPSLYSHVVIPQAVVGDLQHRGLLKSSVNGSLLLPRGVRSRVPKVPLMPPFFTWETGNAKL